MSAATAKIADLDSGVHPDWARTGLSFKAYAAPTASPVCRFYLPPAFGDSMSRRRCRHSTVKGTY